MIHEDTVIKLDKVSKRFNIYRKNIDRIKGVLLGKEPGEVKYALKDVSLEIKRGERVCIMGLVDSGRSTLMKIMSEITLPSKGKVFIAEESNVMLAAKAGMEMEFSCRDNIYAKANAAGIKRRDIEAHIDEILEFAELRKFADLPLKRAPKGSWALLSLGVHLIKDSEIILIDEVFGGGGSYITTKCEDKLMSYLDEHPSKTVVIVTNRVNFIRDLDGRTIVLDKGKIAHDGNLAEARNVFAAIRSRK